MAEGIIGGILGDDDEKTEVKATEALAHRLRVTLQDLGVRQDPSIAIVFYTIAAAGSVLSVWYLLRI
jgi:fumarate reductase subunit D